MSIFVDNTKGSAAEMVADLQRCRSFTHLSEQDRTRVIERCADRIIKSRKDWTPLHPDSSNPCLGCGLPRSKFNNGREGFCRTCYAGKVVDFWAQDVFETALMIHGFSCDVCGEIEGVSHDEVGVAAGYILDNFDGRVRPVLCSHCASDFRSFCRKKFGKLWKKAAPYDQEKMAVGWLAQKVKVLAERVKKRAA